MLFTNRIALLTGESHMDDKNLNNENESNEAKKLRVLGGGEEEHDEDTLKI